MQSKRNKIVLAVICCIIAVFAIVFVTQAVNKKSDASQADTPPKQRNHKRQTKHKMRRKQPKRQNRHGKASRSAV